MRWIKVKRVTLIIVAVGLFGFGLILYPSGGDWWNSYHQSRAVEHHYAGIDGLHEETEEDPQEIGGQV